jgi:predicted aminopeptidase
MVATGAGLRRLKGAVQYLLLIPLLVGCTTLDYYQHLARGQISILLRRTPVEYLVNAPETPDTLRAQLALARNILEFAEATLLLPVGDSYQTYVALSGKAPLQILVSTPAFRLEPDEHCFPVAGCTAYRGYFDPDRAQQESSRLKHLGRDVYVGDVPAYSTLGWFEDPLMSSFIDWPPEQLAELIFHELAHKKLYVPNNSSFNESFATAVARLAVPQWLRASGHTDRLPHWENYRRAQNDLQQVFQETARELDKVYAQANWSPTRMAWEKKQRFAQMDTKYRAMHLKAGLPATTAPVLWRPNNARLALWETYDGMVDRFIGLYLSSGNWAQFHRAASELASGQTLAAQPWSRLKQPSL